MMKLEDLKGDYVLDAVDFFDETREIWSGYTEDCQICRFRLDDVVYSAVEDPEDGYRSSMSELVVTENAEMKNTFPPIKVSAVYFERRKDGNYTEECDILKIYDVKTKELVLEVGTANTDDYYPYFVADFNPKNMITNNQ